MAATNMMGNGASFVPTQWIGRDGMPLTGNDKISQLNQHLQEVYTLCQQVFEEAMHMGCSEEFLRIVLQNMITSLKRTTRNPVG